MILTDFYLSLCLIFIFFVLLLIFLVIIRNKIKAIETYISLDKSSKPNIVWKITKKQKIVVAIGVLVLGFIAFETGVISFGDLFKSEEDIFKEQVANIDVKLLFKQQCATCHSENASGGIGPNLTDNYWIHDLEKKEDLVHNITAGFPAKGMPTFGELLSKVEIAALSDFVYKLKGTNVEGKGPQGYLYEANNDSYEKVGTSLIMADIQVPESIPVISEGGDVARGKELFNVKLGCAHCHGTNAYGDIDNRNIKESNKRYGKNWKRVVDQVLHEGRKGTAMPEWSYLSMKDLKDLKAFVVSVQK